MSTLLLPNSARGSISESYIVDKSVRKLQNLFKSHLNYLDSIPQPLKNQKAISLIAYYRTPDMGTSYFTCKEKHERIEQYHSCRNRSCYLCALKAKQDWIKKQKTRLLNVPHFHVIFTLPHEYRCDDIMNHCLIPSL